MQNTRLVNVNPLTSIIPLGSEGGKEFARIIDLLLFHDYKREGKNITIFNDSAGDFRALDSFENTGRKTKNYIGYQYKFYKSPLTSSHRNSIKNSILFTKSRFEKGKLKKYILVTPEDLSNSATRKDKGDIEWFDNLKQSLDLEFELEHWGHKKILGMFLQTPSIGIFYYPELYKNGVTQIKSLISIKEKYIENLIDIHNSIEFVGMSMYKPEADKGIQMQDIYIPLSIQQESADDLSSSVNAIDPIMTLDEGSKTVILGDPGSGKSTLLKFLTLSGIYNKIQNRYKCRESDRLPVHIILRKYADELKSKTNLSIIDYIIEHAQATFNLVTFDFKFLEYFLDSGKIIFLFDGLDELPDSEFKITVRDRIRSLSITYPGNTIIVTSRIVGYDNPFRFNAKEFSHFKVAKLNLKQMQQFVTDWYKVRINNFNERKANIDDLIDILKDQNHKAIRELAENPLLLTIITLVHRIDAVLPDQRVVLYQKCTETLLNTWQTAKFKTGKNKTSIELRNKRRLEAIAHWMQNQSTGIRKTQRSIIPYEDLQNFLCDFINSNERLTDKDEVIDLAVEYIDFIKNRAGLLIEVGDKSFSFVHLTFQEYLTATFLMSKSEKKGIVNLKSSIIKYSRDPRWYEVIRLLIASLKSEDSQEFIVATILSNRQVTKSNTAILLGGILLDGVVAAELRKNEILEYIILSALKSKTVEEVRSFSNILKDWSLKSKNNYIDIDEIYKKLLSEFDDFQKLDLLLLYESTNINSEYINSQKGNFIVSENRIINLYMLVFGTKPYRKEFHKNINDVVTQIFNIEKMSVITSPVMNLCCSILMYLNFRFDPSLALKNTFEILMTALGTGHNSGPFREIIMNLLILNQTNNHKNIYKLSNNSHIKESSSNRLLGFTINELTIKNILNKNKINDEIESKFEFIRDKVEINTNSTISKLLHKIDIKGRRLLHSKEISNTESLDIWQIFQDDPNLHSTFLNVLKTVIGVKDKPLWDEAVRSGYLPKLNTRLDFLNEEKIALSIHNLSTNIMSYDDIYLLATVLLIETWYSLFDIEIIPLRKQIRSISETPDLIKFIPLKIASLIFKISEGDKNAKKELKDLYNSTDSSIREVFISFNWQ